MFAAGALDSLFNVLCCKKSVRDRNVVLERQFHQSACTIIGDNFKMVRFATYNRSASNHSIDFSFGTCGRPVDREWNLKRTRHLNGFEFDVMLSESSFSTFRELVSDGFVPKALDNQDHRAVLLSI